MERTVIINYKSLCVGGIETYIFEAVKYFHNKGYHIIWLHRKTLLISDIYKDIMLDPQIVENISMNALQLHFFKRMPIIFNDGDDVAILSFTCQDHVRALKIKKDNPNICVRAYLFIPHFTGGNTYPEQDFKLLRKAVSRYMSNIYREWIRSGTVMFFAKRHIDAIEKAYGFEIPQKFKRMVPSIYGREKFSESEAEKRYLDGSSVFRIVSASRFEYPHKGFMIGLVREFPKIKMLAPNAQLIFIGAGDGQKMLEDEIQKLDADIAKDIRILGMMPRERLLEFYRTCQLSISLAGCAGLGARVGLITLPARHYTFQCEVYGFLPESKGRLLDTAPGEPVVPYVEKVLSMSKEEYVQYSKMAYDTFKDEDIITTDILFDNDTYDPGFNITSRDLFCMKWLLIIQKILCRLYGTKEAADEKLQ